MECFNFMVRKNNNKNKKVNKMSTKTSNEQETTFNSTLNPEEASKLFDKMFFIKEERPNFEEMFKVFIKNSPKATIEQTFDAAVRLGWGLAKIQQ